MRYAECFRSHNGGQEAAVTTLHEGVCIEPVLGFIELGAHVLYVLLARLYESTVQKQENAYGQLLQHASA
jgi:hypothetical protein